MSKLLTPPEVGDILRVSLSSECEFWEIECENATVTVLLAYNGTIIDAVIWREGKAERLGNDRARPILEAAIVHHGRDCDDVDE